VNLSHWIERHACFAPEATALRFADAAISYADLAKRIDATAGALVALGVREGDVVAFLGLNSPVLLELLFSCARLGALVSALNWRLAPPEHARVLADCTPRVLLVEPAFHEQVASIRPSAVATRMVSVGDAPHGWETWSEVVDATLPVPAKLAVGSENSPLLLCYTSGTTGAPKGVVLDQAALQWNAFNSTHMHDLTSADRVLTTLPMFHVGGLNIQTLPALHAGACVTLHPRFDPAATLQAIEQERITLTVLVPAQLTAMFDLPRWPTADLSSLRMITTGSTIIGERFARRVIEEKGIPFAQVYGSTETAPIATYQRAADAMHAPGSAGSPALHCEVRVVDADGSDLPVGADGEILVRGRNVTRAYWKQPEQTAAVLENGWYHTGDVGHFDERGRLYVVARKRDMIITGVENVYPEEVEGVLLESPAIAEVCVVGKPDERLGEAVVVAVVLRPDAQLGEAEVIAMLRGRIARYKHPREVHFVGPLPRSALGKLRRADVRLALAAREPTGGG
jgi:fatty-acyl-CoA synthase